MSRLLQHVEVAENVTKYREGGGEGVAYTQEGRQAWARRSRHVCARGGGGGGAHTVTESPANVFAGEGEKHIVRHESFESIPSCTRR